MATKPVLIYSSGGNRRFAEIARSAGYALGSRLPKTVYLRPLFFADQDWRHPDRASYMAALAEHRPVMATVLDWERDEQLADCLDWAEEATQYVDRVVMIPKVIGGVSRLPRRINGCEVVLGYSVPTLFGGTSVPSWEFAGWPVHLLGGSPHAQMAVWRHVAAIADVISADGNYTQKIAIDRRCAWAPGDGVNDRGCGRWWRSVDGDHYVAFAESCRSVRAAWERMVRA